MAQPQKKILQVEELAANRHGKHRLDRMDPRLARHLVMFRPNEAMVKDLLDEARLHIPGLAETNEVIRVFRYNPEYVLALAYRSKFDAKHAAGSGFVAMLSLNKLGLQHLALG